jgi:hypothetical protein
VKRAFGGTAFLHFRSVYLHCLFLSSSAEPSLLGAWLSSDSTAVYGDFVPGTVDDIVYERGCFGLLLEMGDVRVRGADLLADCSEIDCLWVLHLSLNLDLVLNGSCWWNP